MIKISFKFVLLVFASGTTLAKKDRLNFTLKYTSQFAGLDITENCLLGKDLSLEGDFIDKVKKNLYELNIEKINLVGYI